MQIAAIRVAMMRLGRERFGRWLSISGTFARTLRAGWNSRSGSLKRTDGFGPLMTKRTSSFFFLDLFPRFGAMDCSTPSHKISREAIP